MTSSSPSTCTPAGAGAGAAARRALRGDGQLLLAAAQLPLDALRDGLAPTRGPRRSRRAARRGRRSCMLLGDRRRAPASAASFWTGMPSRRSAFTSSSRPVSIASTRRSRENHCRIFERARGVCANWSQSRLGPAPSTLLVKISTVSPDSQRRVERHQPAVDPRADAAVPDLGVDRVGEVDRRRAGRQRDDLALRREDEDLVLLEVDLQASA